LFGEDQARYLVTTASDTVGDLLAAAKTAGVPAIAIGSIGGADLIFAGICTISVEDLRNRHEAWFPTFMSAA
jgi:phosphoribosylformylglycinamidine synthase